MSNISSYSDRPLPPDDALRGMLHNEVHARPPARIRLPALVVYVAVFNDGVTREQECAHLRQLPDQQGLMSEDLQGNFLRLRLPGYTLKWERHAEFTRYSLVQPLPSSAELSASDPALLSALVAPEQWLQGIPGRTIAAIKLAMVWGDLSQVDSTMALARQWLGEHTVVASVMLVSIISSKTSFSMAFWAWMCQALALQHWSVALPSSC